MSNCCWSRQHLRQHWCAWRVPWQCCRRSGRTSCLLRSKRHLLKLQSTWSLPPLARDISRSPPQTLLEQCHPLGPSQQTQGSRQGQLDQQIRQDLDFLTSSPRCQSLPKQTLIMILLIKIITKENQSKIMNRVTLPKIHQRTSQSKIQQKKVLSPRPQQTCCSLLLSFTPSLLLQTPKTIPQEAQELLKVQERQKAPEAQA